MRSQCFLVAAVSAILSFAASSTASAVIYNLNTLETAVVDTVQGRSYYTVNFTGTSNSDYFLAIQASPTESGYNIDSGVLDTTQNGVVTRTQHVSDLQTVVVGGVEYYAFLVNTNEPGGSNALISLDTVKIYTSNTLLTSLGALTSQGVLRYDLDSLDPNAELVFDDNTNPGSNADDFAFFIPTSTLAGAASTDFFYLYQEFGNLGSPYASEAGAELTRYGGGISFNPIPETNVIAPILAVLGVVLARLFARQIFHF